MVRCAGLPILSLLLLASPVVAQNEFVLALKPNKNPEAMLEEKNRLEVALGELMAGPVRVIIPSSNSVIVEGFLNGSVDAAFVSGLEFLVAKKQGAARLLLAVEIDGRTSYSSIWLVGKENTWATIAEAEGKSVAFASRTSTSGYLVPVADLVDRGLLKEAANPETFFGSGNVFYGSGYVSAVERLLAGEAHAAAVSDYVYLEGNHLTAEQKDRLRILQTQGPVPTHGIAVRQDLTAEEQAVFLHAILALNEASHTELRDRVFGSKLVEVDEETHLAVLEQALKKAGVELGKSEQ